MLKSHNNERKRANFLAVEAGHVLAVLQDADNEWRRNEHKAQVSGGRSRPQRGG